MSTQGRSRSPTPTSSEPGTPPQHRPATSPRVGPPSQGDSLGAPTPHERRELVVSLDRLAPHSYPGRRRVGSDDRGMGDQFHDAVTGQVDSATQCPHPSRSPPPVDARAVTGLTTKVKKYKELLPLYQNKDDYDVSKGKKYVTLGQGLIILPSDPKELSKRLQLHIRSYHAGNKSLHNEINEIATQLYRMKILKLKQLKDILKDISHK